MKAAIIPALVAIVALAATSFAAPSDAPDLVAAATLRVEIVAGPHRMGSGSAVNTVEGIHSAAHVTRGIGKEVTHPTTGEKFTIKAVVVGKDGKRHEVTAVERVGPDTVKLSVVGIVKARKLPLAAGPPALGSKVRAYGLYSKSGGHGIVAKSEGRFEGLVPSAVPSQGAMPGAYLRTSAPAAPGMSGGPVVNERNEVVGVVSHGRGFPDGYSSIMSPIRELQ